LAFVPDATYLLDSNPTLTKTPRHPAESGRIEFKAFDTCADLPMYAALCALLKGLVLDTTLYGRTIVPDTELHRLAAMQGWQSPIIAESAYLCLNAAHQALADDPDRALLQTLFAQLSQKLPD
jgi:gamma-glutamyl:cysteine ligase YbdK (ATP-grasp superfamily)